MGKVKRSDEDLAKACQKGDVSALEILFDRYKAPLRNYIRSRCRPKDASFIDTILEEVYVFIFKALRKDEFTRTHPGSFKNWVYQVTRFKCFDAIKDWSRRAKPVSEYYPEEFPGDLDEVRTEPVTDPVVFDQQCRELDKALAVLRPQERRLIMMRRDGLSYKEIKAQPGFSRFSLGRLRQKCSEILEKLRKKIKESSKVSK